MLSQAVQSLSKNSTSDFDAASKVLIGIADKILRSDNEKYRSIKISSKVFQEKILPIDGAIQCLLEMGFQEDGDRFTLFTASNLNDLTAIHSQLTKARESVKRIIPPHVQHSQVEILQRIVSHQSHSQIYENKVLRSKARACVPLDTLHQRALKRLSKNKNTDERHCLLLELLAWFKRDFFTWTDKPKCSNCQSNSNVENTGMHPPSQEDLAWGAARVEAYRCTKCGQTLRFPRYNHPEKLLQTRTGRCGEWANCFTLLCRALDFEARHVMDWTDHVWTEVYIDKFDRWLHCDPCESVCDKPLLYEQGWKKKLSLVVAANSEQVVDVTWRYSCDRVAVNQRRDVMFDAKWLADKIEEINETKCAGVSHARKRELERRRKIEDLEFSSEKQNGERLGGRTSGSLAWRLARGETSGEVRNQDSLQAASPQNDNVIRPSDLEMSKGVICVKYNSNTDEYTRKSNNNEIVSGWEEMLYISNNLQMKEEMDWKQCYLCRTEDSSLGAATWKIEIPPNRKFISAQVLLKCATFGQGVVGLLAASDKKTKVLEQGKLESLSEVCRGSSILSISVFLRGGSGDCAWQKAQLFRESTSQPPKSPSFFLEVKF